MSKTIIVAIDETQLVNFQSVVDSLDSDLCMIKVGSVSFNALGHQAISYASNKGFKIFLDLKLHDIPNTVKKSIKGLVSLPIDMMTIHTSGGLEMMKAAKKAVDGTDIKVFGVTALTSLSDEDTSLIFKRTAAEQVNAMLDLAEQAGIDGIVCSPHELSLVTKRESLLSITPGIRLKDSNDDQNRVMTPKDALKQGANFLVIGRPITDAKNIKQALLEIHNSI
jgi:orotidine-5'-phosphate decarboxylase